MPVGQPAAGERQMRAHPTPAPPCPPRWRRITRMGLAESAPVLWMPLKTVACITFYRWGSRGRLSSHGLVAVSKVITYYMCAFGMSSLILRFPFGMLSRAAPPAPLPGSVPTWRGGWGAPCARRHWGHPSGLHRPCVRTLKPVLRAGRNDRVSKKVHVGWGWGVAWCTSCPVDRGRP